MSSTDPIGSSSIRSRRSPGDGPREEGQSVGQSVGRSVGQSVGRSVGRSVGQRRGEQSFLERVLVGAITLGEVNVRGGGGIPYVRLTRYSILDTRYSIHSTLL